MSYVKEIIHPFNQHQNMLEQDFEICHSQDIHLSEVALHHHDFYEVYFFVSGNVTFLVESRNYALKPYDILLISPLELHQPLITPNKQPYERMVLWLGKAFVEEISSKSSDLSRCFDVQSESRTNLLRLDPVFGQWVREQLDLLATLRESDAFGSDIYARATLVSLLVRLNRAVLDGPVHYELPDRSAPIIENALRYIGEHCQEEISLDALAACCFVSKYHLSREFYRLVGTSPYRYVTQKRLIRAKQLLRAGQCPTDVYHCCGFGDYTNFYRAFKLEYGISPRDFYRQARG